MPGEVAFVQAGIPPAEVAVDEPLIRGLLRSQQPDLAGLQLRHAATGCAAQAGVFGRFLASLHCPPPPGFPSNDYRGIPLPRLAESVEQNLAALTRTRDGPAAGAETVRDRWRAAVAAPADAADTCIHGDLHPRNLVVRDGRLAAVLDWGDMTAGDPAADLGAAWMLFPVTAHAAIWAAYGQLTAATMARAAGWAVFFGVTLLNGGDPALAGIGRRTLNQVCAALRLGVPLRLVP